MFGKIFSFEFILLLIYFIVFLAINVYLYTHYNRQYIIDNWDKYRFKVWIMPFAGIINPEAGNTQQNFGELLWGTVKPIFAALTKPITYITVIMGKIINQIKIVIDKFRAQIAIMRNLIFKIIMQSMKKIENIMATSIFTFAKVNEMTKRQLAIFQNMVYILETSAVAMSSFLKGSFNKLVDFSEVAIWVLPIYLLGPAGIAFPIMATCFSPNTELVLANGKKVKMSQLEIGTKLEDGQIITSILRTKPTEQVYNYCGIIVSGSHQVYDNGEWKQVKYCDLSKPCKHNDYLININTSNNCIRINNVLFKDYDEYTGTNEANCENNKVLSILNNLPGDYELNIQSSRYKIGFSPNASINGKYVLDLDITDDILGIVKHIVHPDDQLYEYGNVIMTAWQKIYYNDNWVNVCNIEEAKPIKNNQISYLYSVITRDNIIRLDNGLVLRDFVEISSSQIR